MGMISLCKAIKDMKRMKTEAAVALGDAVKDHPELSAEYEKWIGTYRLNTTAASAYVAGQFCNLEGMRFNEERRKRAYLGSATACISDDLIDKTSTIKPGEVYLFDGRGQSINKDEYPALGLFYAFHSGLEGLLPGNFKSRFRGLITKYNLSQEQGRKLNGNVNNIEIVKIKNEIGGYSFLLLHRIIFPEENDLGNGFTPFYLPKTTLPATKDNAIFNFGAMFCRLDDLDDLEKDKGENRRSLATEGLVTWKSLKQDIMYVKNGFRIFYPRDRVDLFMSIYSPWSMHLVSNIGNLLEKIPKITRRK